MTTGGPVRATKVGDAKSMATGVNEMKVTTVATGETSVMAAARVEVATAHVSMEEEGRDRLLADALVKPEGIDF